MKKIIKLIMCFLIFGNLAFILSCSNPKYTPIIGEVESRTISNHLNSGVRVNFKSDNDPAPEKKIDLFCEIQTCTMEISGETTWGFDMECDSSDYSQELNCRIFRRVYCGEQKYLLNPIKEEEIYSYTDTLKNFLDLQTDTKKVFFEDVITKEQLVENYDEYGEFGTLAYYVIFTPVNDEYIKILKSYKKDDTKDKSYDEYKKSIGLDVDIEPDDYFDDGDIINPYNNTNYFYDKIWQISYVNYVLDDNNIVFVNDIGHAIEGGY